MDNLTRDAIAAEKAGMSYGKWKAQHPFTNPDSKRYGQKILICKCKICGIEFETTGQRKVTCSDKCRRDLHNQQNRESHTRMLEKRRLAEEGEK